MDTFWKKFSQQHYCPEKLGIKVLTPSLLKGMKKIWFLKSPKFCTFLEGVPNVLFIVHQVFYKLKSANDFKDE